MTYCRVAKCAPSKLQFMAHDPGSAGLTVDASGTDDVIGECAALCPSPTRKARATTGACICLSETDSSDQTVNRSCNARKELKKLVHLQTIRARHGVAARTRPYRVKATNPDLALQSHRSRSHCRCCCCEFSHSRTRRCWCGTCVRCSELLH